MGVEERSERPVDPIEDLFEERLERLQQGESLEKASAGLAEGEAELVLRGGAQEHRRGLPRGGGRGAAAGRAPAAQLWERL